jgi:hypothetical protein
MFAVIPGVYTIAPTPYSPSSRLKSSIEPDPESSVRDTLLTVRSVTRVVRFATEKILDNGECSMKLYIIVLAS